MDAVVVAFEVVVVLVVAIVVTALLWPPMQVYKWNEL